MFAIGFGLGHPARRRLLVACLGTMIALVACPFAAADLSAETKQAIDEAAEAFREKQRVPGLSIAVAVDLEPAYEKGYGLADVENEVPATAESVYRLASISKMLTAVAALQLVEAGKLDLATPIQEYVEFPEKQAPITCKHLLAHQSGIRHYKGDEVRSNIAYANVSDPFHVFANDPLLFAPGEKFSYTTYGYNVLGAAIEGASGQRYVAYVLEHIAKPSGMETLRPDSPYKLIPHRAAGYRMSGPVLVNDISVDVSNKIPGGGWCSEAGDLVRFACALCDGKLLEPETLEEMWTARKTAGGDETGYGYGCNIRTLDGDRRISHSGGQPKVSTFLTYSPAQKTAVAVMTNLRGAPARVLADQLMAIVAGSNDK
ncbi:MAG: class A beta-lactamase-related serine hydrolase [Planctomycetota bacterium]|nr:MAG: class A beta-lactamase-related serine hydrolase [Planctomycetota bacterium]